jgi:hypothetical protein
MGAIDPQRHDEAIAAKHHELDRLRQKALWREAVIMRLAGFRQTYHSRHMWFDGDMAPKSFEDALVALKAMDQDQRNLTEGTTPAQALRQHREIKRAITDVLAGIAEAERAYTGWSRFFLVTSSSGHIHSSMSCSTCRPTTAFGWMPELSGKSEAEAVERCGPTLCSVCFPEAPLDWQSGKKLTKAQAAKLVA